MSDSGMRILHVIRSLDPVLGGPPMIAARLAAAQAGLGHDVTLATYDEAARQDSIDSALASVPHFQAVRVHRFRRPARRGLDRLLARGAKADLEHLVSDCDVVHLHNLWQSLLLAAGRVCRRQGRSYLVLLNGNLDPWSLQQKRFKKKLALAVAFRSLLERAAALHLGNLDEKRLIEPLGLKAREVIIPNGVFLEEIEPLPEPGTFRRRHPELGGRRFVLFLSRLHYKKGLDCLAEAFALVASRHPEVDLVVAGPDDGARPAFEARIARHGLSARVHVIGPVFGPDKLAALVDADCFCLPSWQEGFSVAITEALACGKPVVITKGCHFPEVAEAGAGEVVQRSSEAVAAALDRVLADRDLRRKMGEAARRLIKSRYTWPKIAEMTLDAYRKILAA